MRASTISALLLSMTLVQATNLRATSDMNPIRKVVSLLQAMQTKVSAEGEKEEALYKKFMCYCQNSGNTLQEGIEAGAAKIEKLTSELKAAEEGAGGLKAAIEKAQADRADAKAALKDGAAVREKEAAAFAAEKADADANIGSMNAALDALSKGMGGFLQTAAATSLRSLLLKNIPGMYDMDRQALTSFLQGSQGAGYAPQSGEIVGILKQMSETMTSGLAEATAAEKEAAETYDAMVAAKTKEIETLTATIEAKLTAQGDAAVAVVQMKNDLADTKEDLGADQGFLAELAKGCDSKKGEWEVVVKTRAEEMVALADTIKILNDDDALELFKKTLPSASASFMQVEVSTVALKARALAAVRVAQSRGHNQDRAGLDLIALALRGNKIGFGKVIDMIDAMVVTLKKEQQDDDNKVEYCGAQFDQAEDKSKELERAASAAEAGVATTTDALATVTAEIAALEDGIKALDKSVAEATENRKEEHANFEELMASNGAAKELLGFAKNRLNKFYNPKLYKAAPKTELSAEDRIFVSEGGTPPPTAAPGGIAGTGISAFAEISAHLQDKAAPPPPPETFGAYKKKGEENTGVMAMMDLLVKDLDKEMQESGVEEKNAQADYEEMMKHSSEKRTLDAKAITDKASAKAELEGDLDEHKAAGENAQAELLATSEFIADLHGDCDWLLKNADARKAARNHEIDGLGNAKAVLSGADYSFVQTKTVRYLRH